MADFMDRLMNIDNRVIYVVMAAAVVVPMLIPDFIMPITVTEPVRDLYDQVESLPPGSRVFVTMDFDPAVDPEMTPMAIAFMKHCFRRDLEVTGMSLFPQGVTLGYENMRAAAKHTFNEISPEGGISEVKVEAKELENWVFLGAQPGG